MNLEVEFCQSIPSFGGPHRGPSHCHIVWDAVEAMPIIYRGAENSIVGDWVTVRKTRDIYISVVEGFVEVNASVQYG